MDNRGPPGDARPHHAIKVTDLERAIDTKEMLEVPVRPDLDDPPAAFG